MTVIGYAIPTVFPLKGKTVTDTPCAGLGGGHAVDATSGTMATAAGVGGAEDGVTVGVAVGVGVGVVWVGEGVGVGVGVGVEWVGVGVGVGEHEVVVTLAA